MTTAPLTSPSAEPRLSALGVVRSEWIKLRTVRSTVWCIGILLLLLVGIGLLVAGVSDFGGLPITGDAARAVVVGASTGGLNVAVLLVAVLGSLIITGEYTTGMIRSTFTAVPRRTGAIAAKALVLAATTFVATAVAIWLTALVTWPILASKGIAVELSEPSVFMPLFGGALYVTMIALLAFGLGTILRSTAGALATVLGIILVAPLILQLLGVLTRAEWVGGVASVLPQNAGSQLFSYGGVSLLPPIGGGGLELNGWGGFGILAVWDLVALGIALILVKRRDA